MDRKWLYRGVSVAAVVLSGACARDATAPAASNARPAVVATAGGSYLVAFTGSGIPASFGGTASALGGTVAWAHAGAGIAAVTGLTPASATQLAAAAGVADVEPDIDISLDAPVAAVQAAADSVVIESQANPTTASRYAWQWNMRAIKADQAWAAGKLGSSGVTVAIIDTGLDYNVADLNGLVDLSRSASFVASDDSITTKYFSTRNPVTDYNGHGTNVATQVSSKAAALAGVTSRTTLLGVKVLSQAGRGSLSSVLNGVLWSADHGADVANMSLGGGFAKAGHGKTVGLITRVFNYAQQKGTLIVVAAGNESEDLDHNGNELKTYCDDPAVLCVSAVGPNTWAGNPDTFSFYSNFGRSAVNVAGPGGNGGVANTTWPWGTGAYSWVWSYCSKTLLAGFTSSGTPVLGGCQAGNRILGFIGTSQATPHVAGLAALLVAEIGHGRPQLVKQRIMQSADDLGQPGVDPYYGAGRINVARALGL